MTLAPRTLELAQDPPAHALVLVATPRGGRPSRHILPDSGCVLIGGSWAEGEVRGAGAPVDEGAGRDLRIALDDPTVSARHARIELVRGRARVLDLGSRNGTWVGGARVAEASLPPGVCAVVGRTSIVLEPRDEPVPSPTELAGQGAALPGAIGRSPAMLRLAGAVRTCASLSAPVLIRGESGSGKELVARALHQLSVRAKGPFHAQNLGALPRELAEGELFGHERGAFTGAIAARPGVFELADGGTLFLDELGELPLDMQAKLLRVLETGEVRRIGARAIKRVDVRVVAATWAPLEARVVEGTFREDLYHRIAVLVIDVPPLRDRRADVVPIAESMLEGARADLGVKQLSAAAASRLCAEEWPGNVRELRNVVYRAAATSGEVIELADVARALSGRAPSAPPPRLTIDPRIALGLVDAHGGNVTRAARSAGVPRETLRDAVRSARGRLPRG